MHLQRGLQAAVRAGHDTDTVAAIAGSLLGARYGASAVPTQWRRMVHGWPGLRAHDLVELAVSTSVRGRRVGEWPSVAVDGRRASIPALGIPHPIDPGILLGTITDLGSGPRARRAGDRLAVRARPRRHPGRRHDGTRPHRVLDQRRGAARRANPHLDFVLDDASSALRQFRAEGKRVLVHCRHGRPAHPGRRAAVCRRPRCRPELAERSIREALPGIRGEGRLWDVAAHGA